MKIMHICNWCSGITARNVNGLKQWSKHSHELVARIAHPYAIDYEPPTHLERNTSKELVLAMAEEADALHFHAVGHDGTAELPETIHGIDWAQFRGKKRFILSGMCSMLARDRESWMLPAGERFRVRNLSHYDLLVGPHLSCKKTYDERLQYVPDIIPINDWLYTPLAPRTDTGSLPRPRRACSFKGWERQEEAKRAGIDFRIFPTPTRMSTQLAWRRREACVTLDNYTDGHWGLFGMESLAQGIPCTTYTHPLNMECFEILKAKRPPFLDVQFGGGNLAEIFRRVMAMDSAEWLGWSLAGRHWIETYYDPEILTWRWDAVYDSMA